jgi:hypothetical protein
MNGKRSRSEEFTIRCGDVLSTCKRGSQQFIQIISEDLRNTSPAGITVSFCQKSLPNNKARAATAEDRKQPTQVEVLQPRAKTVNNCPETSELIGLLMIRDLAYPSP